MVVRERRERVREMKNMSHKLDRFDVLQNSFREKKLASESEM